MVRRKKTPRLTKERAKQLMVKIFGRTGDIKASPSHIPEEWTATFGGTTVEVYKSHDGAVIVVAVTFENRELYQLFYNPETLECDYEYTSNEHAAGQRGQMIETASLYNYALIRYEDALRLNLEIIEE